MTAKSKKIRWEMYAPSGRRWPLEASVANDCCRCRTVRPVNETAKSVSGRINVLKLDTKGAGADRRNATTGD